MSNRYFRGACLGLVAALIAASQVRAQTWIETSRLMQPQPGPVDRFGWSIAVGGEWLVVGAMEEQHVYVFHRNGPAWALAQEIAAPAGANGYASSLAIDGDRFVVGAPASFGTTGRAWVYARNGSTWSLEGTLAGADIVANADFGASVAIAGDRIVVGAPLLSDLGTNSGAAYVFERTGGVWVQTSKLLDAAGSAGANFGGGVALKSSTILIASPYDSSTSPYAGSVIVFSQSGPGWTQGQRIVPSSSVHPGDFGVSISIDGVRFVASSGFGRAYVFHDSGGTWTEEAVLEGSDIGNGGATFGIAVALLGDRAVVGSLVDGNFAGSAYVFAFDGSTWAQEARLFLPDGKDSDFFGCAVALQGEELIAGAWGRDGTGNWTGLASLFVRHASAGRMYCPGDGSVGPCPCLNESDPGLGQGCRNSLGYGALLVGVNSDSVSADDLLLVASGMNPNTMSLLGAGQEPSGAQGGIPFGGNGLRCIGGSVLRLDVQTAGRFGSAEWGPGLALTHAFRAGETWYFQTWYRDPSGSSCGSTFDTTSAVQVNFDP